MASKGSKKESLKRLRSGKDSANKTPQIPMLQLEVSRKLSEHSDRVLCVDLHPSEPWTLASLYDGSLKVWNHESRLLVKSFEVCEVPVRAAKFVPRKNWIITGSDDMQIRVFNYNTLESVHIFEAHSAPINSITMHPTQLFILTSSDDKRIMSWSFVKEWCCTKVFAGHQLSVNVVAFDPTDYEKFCSASSDCTIKVWSINSEKRLYTLGGHSSVVTSIAYYQRKSDLFLISGGEDKLVKIWDCQEKICLNMINCDQSISAVSPHPKLPVIISGFVDGSVCIWHEISGCLLATLKYGLGEVCSTDCDGNSVALGFKKGIIVVELTSIHEDMEAVQSDSTTSDEAEEIAPKKEKNEDAIEEFLRREDDPNYWITCTNRLTGEDVILQEDDLRIIKNIQSGKYPDQQEE